CRRTDVMWDRPSGGFFSHGTDKGLGEWTGPVNRLDVERWRGAHESGEGPGTSKIRRWRLRAGSAERGWADRGIPESSVCSGEGRWRRVSADVPGNADTPTRPVRKLFSSMRPTHNSWGGG